MTYEQIERFRQDHRLTMNELNTMIAHLPLDNIKNIVYVAEIGSYEIIIRYERRYL